MRSDTGKTEAVRQKNERILDVQAEAYLSGPRIIDQRGFTLVELVTILIIVGILAVAVAPRFFDASLFQSRGFADQVLSSLRYAQKTAIAQRRNVCVALAAGGITMTIASASGSASPCNTTLVFPAGGNTITAPAGVTLAPAGTISFDSLGQIPPPKQTITVSGAANNIVVEAVTGYVHSP